MGKHGFFGSICKSLDRMEEEMCGLCRLFRKEKGHKHGPCSPCHEEYKPKKPPCELPPDFRPPCGWERCCCEEKRGMCK